MPTSPSYFVESVLYALLTLFYFLYFSALLLSLRFTPRRKIPEVRLYGTMIAFVSVCMNIPRTLDVSSVFGIINFQTNQLFYNLCTALHVFAACLFIRSIARTLYVQLQQQMEWYYTPLLFTTPIICSIGNFVLNIVSYTNQHDATLLSKLMGAKGLLFNVTVFVIAIVDFIIFVRLRAKLMAFIQRGSPPNVVELRKITPIATQVAFPAAVGGDSEGTTPEITSSSLPQTHTVQINHLAVVPTNATVPPSPSSHPSSSSSTSSHEARVASLRSAVRTLTIMSLAVTCFCAFSMISLKDSYLAATGTPLARGKIYGPSPETFQPIFNLFTYEQQLILALLAWYLWSPLQWTKKVRREKELDFWHTLRHGVDERSRQISGDKPRIGFLPLPSPRKATARVASLPSVAVVNADPIQPTFTTAMDVKE